RAFRLSGGRGGIALGTSMCLARRATCGCAHRLSCRRVEPTRRGFCNPTHDQTKRPSARALRLSGGRGGIRTHEELALLPVFKTGAFNRSATLPQPGRLCTVGTVGCKEVAFSSALAAAPCNRRSSDRAVHPARARSWGFLRSVASRGARTAAPLQNRSLCRARAAICRRRAPLPRQLGGAPHPHRRSVRADARASSRGRLDAAGSRVPRR